MATPLRSRYPRPLKATLSFNSAAAASAAANGSQVSEIGTHSPTFPGGRRVSPEDRSPISAAFDSKEENAKERSPRRSSSMGSLSDPDCVLWPQVSPTNQSDTEGSERPLKDDDFHKFSHKRSSSCSSADRLRKAPHLKNGQVHTRTSIEGLNQEVSSVFEGKAFMPYLSPDGHVAPVRDLLNRMTVDTQTPPHVGPHPQMQTTPTYQRQSSLSPHLSTSPLPNPSPPSHPSPPSQNTSATTGICNTHSRDSPADYHSNMLHPSSPKPSFDREPPDGAERCTIRRYSGDFLPRGPDKSKGNIVFKGTVFGPPLFHSHSLKAVSVNSL